LITADTTLLSPPRASAEQAVAYIVRRGSVYTPEDIATIVGYYWRYSMPVGIDPLLAIAQCIHETSELDPATGKWRPLSTWWAQRPNRNPAGLGVTGEESNSQPADTAGWVEDTRTQPSVWRKGLAFASWDESSRAHIGRLLAYALPEGRENQVQGELISFSLAKRPLARNLRGTAPTLKPLGAKFNPTGQGWAYPGDNYGNKIAELAQAITLTNP
jgi:hypothetical protein